LIFHEEYLDEPPGRQPWREGGPEPSPAPSR
jgi:hypothetical protein